MDNVPSSSPNWSSTTKLVVGLTIVAILAALLVQFRNIIGPLILAFMLAYLLYPLASKISDKIKISWRATINIIYLLLVIIVGAILFATGYAILQQMQSLIGFIERNVTNLPELVATLSSQVFKIGPFEFSLAQYDLQSLLDQILSWVQPVLGRAGSLISTLAAGAAVTVTWSLFVLVISYFLLAEADRVTDELVHIELPGYSDDVRRLGAELGNIWNAFLRGQIIIVIMVVITYAILMALFGMRFSIGIAILAGLARFVPYLGTAILWIVTGLVAYFQGANYFNLPPLTYAIIVLAVGFITDQIYDNIITPRLFGKTLGIHPAAVLVTAIIAARLIGLIGLLLAAPVVASFKLLTTYIVRKMFDLEPWPAAIIRLESSKSPSKYKIDLISWWRSRITKKPKNDTS